MMKIFVTLVMMIYMTAMVNTLLICKEDKLVALSGANIVDGSFPMDYERLSGRSCKKLVERVLDCTRLFNILVVKWERMPDFSRSVSERYMGGYHCEGIQVVGNNTMLASTACAESKELAHGLACFSAFFGVVYGGMPSLYSKPLKSKLFF